MPLINVNSSSGSFLPHIRYDAKAGRIFRIDRDATATTVKTDITRNFRAVFDFDSVAVGWVLFTATGPDYQMAPFGDPFPPRPSKDYKDCVHLHVKLSKECSNPEILQDGRGDVREFAGTAQVWKHAINDLYDNEYLRLAADYPGKLPVVVLKGDPLPVESGFGSRRSTNYRPVWQIVSWVPRPADMPLTVPVQVTTTMQPAVANGNAQAGPPRPGSTRMAPPAAVTSPPQQPLARVPSTDDDFG